MTDHYRRFAFDGPARFALGAVMLAFILRALNIVGESLWRDEIDTIRFAFAPSDQLLGNLTREGFNGPLYHGLMRAWLTLTGINDFSVRYFSLLCGVALVAIVYALARRLFGARTAAIAAWLTAIAPVLVWYGGEGKMYTLQPLLVVLALYALRRAIEPVNSGTSGPGKRRVTASAAWWLAFVAAVSLGYYVHLLTPLFLAVAGVFVLAWWPDARRHWRGLLIATAACSVPYLPLLIWQLPLFVSGGDIGHAFYPLDVIGLSLAYNWSVGLSSQLPFAGATLAWIGIACYVGMAAVGIASGWRKGIGRSILGVLAWLALPTLLVYAVSTRIPIFQPRYVLWSAPALYLLVALGLVWLWSRALPLAAAAGFLLTALAAAGLLAQIDSPIRPDNRGAAQYLAERLEPDDSFVFQMPYTRYAFEYYLPRFLPGYRVDPEPQPDDGLATLPELREQAFDAPFTNAGATEEDVDQDLSLLIDPDRRVWLVEAESAQWDERGLVRNWFDRRMELVERRDFRGVTLGVYRSTVERRAFLPLISR